MYNKIVCFVLLLGLAACSNEAPGNQKTPATSAPEEPATEEGQGLALIPTAEVPLTNIARDVIYDAKQLLRDVEEMVEKQKRERNNK